MLVKDIMSKKIVSVSKNDNVQKFISLMQKNKIPGVLVIDNKKLCGMVTYKDMILKTVNDPKKEKIKKIMTLHPPKLTPDMNIDDAAKLIFDTGIRSLPVIEKKKVVGMLSSFDIIKAAAKTKEFKKTCVEDVMDAPILTSIDTDIGKARVIMRERNISVLPVIDHKGNLGGVLTAFDMIKAIKPHEKISWYSAAAQMERLMGIPISTIMEQNPVTSPSKSTLTEIADLMAKRRTSGVIIVRKNIPEGVVTLKDLLEAYISTLGKKGLYYQMIGIEKEDAFITDTVDRMVRDTIKKLSAIYKPRAFFLHVKTYETGIRGRRKYSIRIRFKTDKNLFVTQSYDWDLRDAVGLALDKLETVAIKERDHKKGKAKKRILRNKELRR